MHNVERFENASEMQGANEGNHWAFIGEDVVPCQCSNEIRRKKRNNDKPEKNVAILPTTKSNEIREWITNDNGEERRYSGITKTANELRPEFC